MGKRSDLAPMWSLAGLNNTPAPPQGELISLDRIEGGTGRLNDEESSSNAEGRAFETGDVLFGKLRPYLAKYWLADKDGTAQGDIHIYHPSDETEPRFLAYIVGSNEFIRLADAASTGTKMPRVEWSKVAQFQVPAPPLDTQRAVADYLDRETTEIDGMRTDLDEMERLLTERRAAIISETMLHLALDHPRVQVGALVGLISGSGFPHKYQGQAGKQFPFYKVGSMSLANPQGFIRDDRNSISKDDAHQLGAHIIPANSVLMAKIGAALLLGRFVRNEKSCCIDNNMLALIPNNNVDSKFLMLALSLVDIALLERPGPVPTLDLVGLRQNRIPLPPLAEQRRVADEIDRETAEIDSMLEDITKLRDLLAERRAAVISAAVTGKIDIPVSLDDKDEPHA